MKRRNQVIDKGEQNNEDLDSELIGETSQNVDIKDSKIFDETQTPE